MGIFGFYPAWLRWHWADSPDGEDCYKKVVWAGKWTSVWGVWTSYIFTNAEIVSGGLVVTNWGVYATAFIRHFMPIAALGPLYASVTCLNASFRGKEDIRNHVYGGLSTGALWYVMQKKWHNAMISAFWVAVAAAVFNARRMDGDQFEFIPNDYVLSNMPSRNWHARGPLLDFSPTKDYKPMQSQYYFPAVAERVSTYAAKPGILVGSIPTEVRVEYNGIG